MLELKLNKVSGPAGDPFILGQYTNLMQRKIKWGI